LDNTDLEIDNNNIDIAIADFSDGYAIDIRNMVNAASINMQNNNFGMEAGPVSDLYGVSLNNSDLAIGAIIEENNVKIINNTFQSISELESKFRIERKILGVYIDDFSSEPAVSGNVFKNIDYGISNLYIRDLEQSEQINLDQDLTNKYKNDMGNQFSDIPDDQKVIIGEIVP
jgi:hypothetical protein